MLLILSATVNSARRESGKERKEPLEGPYQHFLFRALFSTPVTLRFCLSTRAQGSHDDFADCIHLIVVRNLAHSGNPHNRARSSAVCPFLLHKSIWASLATRRLRHSRLPTLAALCSGVSPRTSFRARQHVSVSNTVEASGRSNSSYSRKPGKTALYQLNSFIHLYF